MRQQTQQKQVLEVLLQGHSITPIEALEMFGCFRLASVIHVLRKEGYDIVTDMVKIRGEEDGSSYASYYLQRCEKDNSYENKAHSSEEKQHQEPEGPAKEPAHQ